MEPKTKKGRQWQAACRTTWEPGTSKYLQQPGRKTTHTKNRKVENIQSLSSSEATATVQRLSAKTRTQTAYWAIAHALVFSHRAHHMHMSENPTAQTTSPKGELPCYLLLFQILLRAWPAGRSWTCSWIRRMYLTKLEPLPSLSLKIQAPHDCIRLLPSKIMRKRLSQNAQVISTVGEAALRLTVTGNANIVFEEQQKSATSLSR